METENTAKTDRQLARWPDRTPDENANVVP